MVSSLCGCSGAAEKQVEFSLEFERSVDLSTDGFELMAPVLYPDFEYGGVYIAGENTNAIFRYDPMEGLKKVLEPIEVPSGIEGVAAFCYADGDYLFRPARLLESRPDGPPTIFQLTPNGRVRRYELPEEPFEEVRNLGVMVYLGDGKLLLETSPRGPFATIDLVTGEAIRLPTEPPPRGVVQTLVPDHGAKEVYLVRRAKDMSIYFLRYTFLGTYRGPAYVRRREFIAAAASVDDVHLLQYVSGAVDLYDKRYQQVSSMDLTSLIPSDYDAYLGLTIVWDKAYVVGQQGPVGQAKGYDLLVFLIGGKR